MVILVNGDATDCLPVADRGLHYGDGLFETLAVVDGVPLLWEPHMSRLALGCARLGLPAPDTGLLRAESAQVCGAARRGVLKIIVTRGPASRGYAVAPHPAPTRIVALSPWPCYPDDNSRRGVAVRLCATILGGNPALAGIKHLNRLEQVLARAEWGDDYAEGLMRDARGHVVEGTMSNLFLVAGGILVTPDLTQSGVAGVIRAQVLNMARGLEIGWREEPVTLARLETAEEAFLTNSVIGVWPVARLGARSFPIGKVTQKIQKALAGARCIAAGAD